jgi:hypothetical protein
LPQPLKMDRTMAELSARERQALANGLATLMSLARHSLSQTQTKMATRSAGNLLWLLGIDQYEAYGIIFHAIPPEGETIDADLSNRLVDLKATAMEAGR